MSDPFMIFVDRDDPVPVHTVQELDEVLDQIDQHPRYQTFPVVADIVSPDDRYVLQILLGKPGTSFLIWHVENETIEASAGTIPDEPGLAFNYGGSRTDAYEGTLIPAETARAAARQFLGTAQRPTGVAWKTPQYS